MNVLPKGVRHIPGHLSRDEQVALVDAVREVVAAAPLYRPEMPRTGKPLSVRMTNCGELGWVTDRSGYRYQPTHPVTGTPWPAIPPKLLRIWQENKKTCMLITHSIGEAVFLADRVVVMTPRPGKINKIIPIDLPRPRKAEMRLDPKFIEYVKDIQERIGLVRI